MTLLGHEAAWREWREAMAGARMHHAWLLAGRKGLGKGLFARAAAAELVAEPGVHQPDPERHPDILIPEHPPESKEEQKKRDDGAEYRRKRSIPIDEIRQVQSRLTTRPTIGSRRAVIIDPVDHVEANAANALLKSLEEPPLGTFFLLVAHQPERLLPTIRSRCRILRFAPLPDEEIEALLAREAGETDAGNRAAAVRAAGGSPGAALEFLAQDLGTIDNLMRGIARNGDRDFALRGKLAAEIGARPDRERIAAVIELARATLARISGDAPRAAIPPLAEGHADLVRLAAQATTYNFDPGLLVMHVGGLLAAAAAASERADA
jgi:DNA polymerase III subunit delta'